MTYNGKIPSLIYRPSSLLLAMARLSKGLASFR